GVRVLLSQTVRACLLKLNTTPNAGASYQFVLYFCETSYKLDDPPKHAINNRLPSFLPTSNKRETNLIFRPSITPAAPIEANVKSTKYVKKSNHNASWWAGIERYIAKRQAYAGHTHTHTSRRKSRRHRQPACRAPHIACDEPTNLTR
ncbi:unnamed protein product, partial [Ectocarpus fasciculatus]